MNRRSLDWKPTASLRILKKRANMLRQARCFFSDRNVLEVETPILTQAGSSDPYMANVRCRLATHPGEDFFLQTSPESAMKRMLAAGCPDIFQICKVFRDTELGSLHQPEFTMIEWYRRAFTLDKMIEETCSFIMALCRADPQETNRSPLGTRNVYCYQDLFQTVAGLDPVEANLQELAECASQKTGLVTPEFAEQLGQDRKAWLDYLMSHLIIPELPRAGLVVIRDYPAEQAALARLKPDDERFAERFEIFFAGLELANGYHELREPDEQRRRFEKDRRQRSRAGKQDMPIDAALLAALEAGLPDCCGVAVGFDRLMMSLYGLTDITESISFGLQQGTNHQRG
jgi:lysyl-tRNA synthetase class 2